MIESICNEIKNALSCAEVVDGLAMSIRLSKHGTAEGQYLFINALYDINIENDGSILLSTLRKESAIVEDIVKGEILNLDIVGVITGFYKPFSADSNIRLYRRRVKFVKSTKNSVAYDIIQEGEESQLDKVKALL